jgi:hypothetical protein
MTDFSGPAELPRAMPDTRLSPPAIFTHLHYPTTAAEFQTALDAVVDGDCIVLPLGSPFAGNFVLRKRATQAAYVYIMPLAKVNGVFSLTPSRYLRGTEETQGQRATYGHSRTVLGNASPLGQLQTDTLLPVIRCEAGAGYYWFEGVEFSRATGNAASVELALVDTQNIFDAVNGSTACTVLADVPHHIVIGHSLIHGEPTAYTRRGLYLGTYVGIRDSSIYYIRASGAESCAIGSWNSPGVVAAVNCFLEAGAQSFITGGAGPSISSMPVNDITIKWCHSTKDPTGSLTQKNHFESKNGGRWLIEDCVLEHNRPVAQDGTNLLFQTLNDNNISPAQQSINDVAIRNIVLDGGGPIGSINGRVGYSLYGEPIVFPALPTRRVHVTNLYARNICGTASEAAGSDGWLFQLVGGATDLLLDHITAEAVTVGLIMNRAVIDGVDTRGVTNLEVRDCLFGKGIYGSLWEDGGREGNAALTDAVAGTANVHNNVFYGVSTAPDPASAYPTGNFYVDRTAVGFQSWVQQNPGALATTSAYHNAASDSGDIGANYASLATMESAVRETTLPWGGDPTPPTPPDPSVVTTLVLAPSTVGVVVGAAGAVNAQAYDQYGALMTLPALTGHTSDAAIATVSVSGSVVTAVGVAVGSANVTVSSGVVTSNTLTVTVSAAPAPAPAPAPSDPGPITSHPVHPPKIKKTGGNPHITGA